MQCGLGQGRQVAQQPSATATEIEHPGEIGKVNAALFELPFHRIGKQLARLPIRGRPAVSNSQENQV